MNESLNKMMMEMKNVKQNSSPSKKPYKISSGLRDEVKKVLRDIDANHNNAWAVEMYNRNENYMDNIALAYRGNKIAYSDIYSKAYDYACALKQMGYEKGDEIPVCSSNIPEFVYIFLACSLIGATINVVGEWFDKNYLKDIINNTGSKTMFVSDDIYSQIKDVVLASNVQNIVMFSLTDSLREDKFGNKVNPYAAIDSKFHVFDNKVSEYKENTSKEVMSEQNFQALAKLYKGNVIAKSDIDDVCAITYTSGTTTPGCPKGVIHANRSYITLSRFKDKDVSGMPAMKNLTVLAHIPTYTHMDLSCSISDTLHCNCTLALEPFYDKDFFPYSLIINKPNFVPAGVGFWVNLCKLLNYSESFKKVNMPYLMLPTVTGEACSAGEEKFINYTSRKHKFGTAKLPFPLAPVTVSIGGGTTESSGIFVTLFKALQEKKLSNIIHKNTLGLTPYRFADIEVLDKFGKYCNEGEPGLLVANNPCSMLGYTNSNANANIHVIDAYGKEWLNLGTYSYKSDKAGRIKMKGRLNSNINLNDGTVIPYYKIEDTIGADTKNIMSHSLVKINDSEYVCHVELQPNLQGSEESVINSCIERLKNDYSLELLDKLYIRIRSFNESFPLAPSGKRDTGALMAMGIDNNCLAVRDLINNKENIHQKKLTKN